MTATVPPHWLRLNDKVSSPAAFVVLDTETSWETGDKREVHVPRCWAMTLVVRDGAPPPSHTEQHFTGEAMIGLAGTVDRLAAEQGELWLFAHNLGFDLAVSALPERLVELGWSLGDFWLGDESTWCVLKKGRNKLMMTDSWSWLSAPLSEIATKIKRKKVPLPANDDSPEAWAERCRTDVDILVRALLVLMDWWDANDLGRFGITGAGCGWAAARHRMRARSILVGPDDERNRNERQAVYGGRREAFRCGAIERAHASDFDLVAAYPTVAAHFNLPRRPGRRFWRLRADHPFVTSSTVGCIASVRIGTDVPVAPVRIGSEVWYPVGDYVTTICSPEIALAVELGCKVEIGEGRSYELGPGLKQWATWVINLQEPGNTAVPEIVKMVAKGWGRSVIGRFAARTSRQILSRPAVCQGWSLEHGRHQESGCPMDRVTIGGEERWYLQDQEGRDSLPALFAYVESLTRSALTRIILSRPEGAVLQCDTDGWLERDTVRRKASDLPEVPWPHRVARKGRYDSVRIIGPVHMELDDKAHRAGIGKTADRGPEGEFIWWDWPGLRWQLQHSATGSYTRTRRVAVLHDNIVKRWVYADGTTKPVHCVITEAGDNELVLDTETAWAHQQGTLAGEQHPRLLALLR